MHIMVVAGCVNIEVQQFLKHMRLQGIPIKSVQDFVECCTLPSMHGKLNPDWFTVKRLGKLGADND